MRAALSPLRRPTAEPTAPASVTATARPSATASGLSCRRYKSRTARRKQASGQAKVTSSARRSAPRKKIAQPNVPGPTVISPEACPRCLEIPEGSPSKIFNFEREWTTRGFVPSPAAGDALGFRARAATSSISDPLPHAIDATRNRGITSIFTNRPSRRRGGSSHTAISPTAGRAARRRRSHRRKDR